MKPVKYTVEKPIRESQLGAIPEKENRVFKGVYTDRQKHIHSKKYFQRKHNLVKFLDNPNLSKIKLYVGDVHYEQ